MDRLLVHVRTALGRDPFDGSAYVFRNRSGSRLKVLHGDAQGIGLCVWRLAVHGRGLAAAEPSADVRAAAAIGRCMTGAAPAITRSP